MSMRATKSGLSRDIQQKMNAKYDPELGQMCLEWITEMVNSTLSPGEGAIDICTAGDAANLSKTLHDGTILARMVNSLQPGAIPSSKYTRPPKLAFKQMELIGQFIELARGFGVPDHECFSTVDLFEDQNLHQVLVCLQSLGRKAKSRGLPGFGPKESAANPRNFSDEQLRAGVNVIGLQMGTNKGASQAGMTFGKQRMIID